MSNSSKLSKEELKSLIEENGYILKGNIVDPIQIQKKTKYLIASNDKSRLTWLNKNLQRPDYYLSTGRTGGSDFTGKNIVVQDNKNDLIYSCAEGSYGRNYSKSANSFYWYRIGYDFTFDFIPNITILEE